MFIPKRYMGQVENINQPGISLSRKEGLPSVKELVEKSVQTPESIDNKYYPRLEAVFNLDLEDLFELDMVEGVTRYHKIEKRVIELKGEYGETLKDRNGEALKTVYDPIEINLNLLRTISNEIASDNDFIENKALRELVKYSYLSKINEKIAIWSIAKNYRDFEENAQSYEDKKTLELESRKFAARQKVLFKYAFGQPNLDLFNQTRSTLRFDLDRVQTDNPEIKEAIARAKEIIGGTESKQMKPILTEKQKEIFRKRFVEKYVVSIDLNQIVSDRPDGLISQDVHAELARKLLDSNGMAAFGYVVRTTEDAGASVTHKANFKEGSKGEYKAGMKLSSIMDIASTIGHEFTHALRRIYGELYTGLQLLRSGTFGYLASEEGVAQLAESVFTKPEVPDVIGDWRYVVAGLVWGLDKEKNGFGYAESQELIEKLIFIQKAGVEGMEINKAKEYAKDNSIRSNLRNFRGTFTSKSSISWMPEIKGVCSTKDVAYVHGNVRIAEFLSKYSEDLTGVDLAVLIAGGKVSLDTSDLLLLEQLGIFKLSNEVRNQYRNGQINVFRGQNK